MWKSRGTWGITSICCWSPSWLPTTALAAGGDRKSGRLHSAGAHFEGDDPARAEIIQIQSPGGPLSQFKSWVRHVREAFMWQWARSAAQRVVLPAFVCIMLVGLYAYAESNRSSRSPLHQAVFRGDVEQARCDLNAGAAVNAKDGTGSTALQIAARTGQAELVRLFLDHGARINESDNLGSSPLHEAVAFGRTEVAMLLLARGADVRARNRFGRTPLHNVVCNHSERLTRRLLDAGADPNARDDCGGTPLHLAAIMGDVEAARVLIQRGADVNLRDRAGATPLQLVDRARGGKMLELLRRSGAR